MRLVVLLLCLASCVEERGDPTRFVGTFEGARTLVFVVRDPSQTNAYACDGSTSPALFEWFVNSSGEDTQTIGSDGGTADIAIDFVARTGTLTTAGTARDFALVPIDDRFGLYRGAKTEEDIDYEIGIILLDDETQNGVLGISDAGSFTTVVSPAIVPTQTVVTLLNGVRIPIASALNAYAR